MSFVLLTICPDRRGISASVTGFVSDAGGFIVESRQHGDPDTGQFFLRIAFRAADGEALGLPALRSAFAPIAERFEMNWAIEDLSVRPRMLVAVSRFGHCLNDLLHRWRNGQLPIELVGIVSNHDDMRGLVEWHGLPYHHLPISPHGKTAQERAFGDVIASSQADLVVLARYMQILSPDFCRTLAGRCINIHHSFLPSFKGARPYHQAHARGVKIIGATAHYVTSDLDEGPIIEQDIERVDHDLDVSDLIETGQDIEARVLARAVRWHAERRVLLNGAKTVVFR